MPFSRRTVSVLLLRFMARSLGDQICHFHSVRDQIGVARRHRTVTGSHPFCHVTLQLWIDEMIVIRNQKPGRLRLPGWCRYWCAKALFCNGFLDSSQNAGLREINIMREGFVKTVSRDP